MPVASFMNIALFGGTFDPIHRGHLKVARTAAERFGLKQVWFIPADVPPHKLKTPITACDHRYATVALGLVGEKDFIPSLPNGVCTFCRQKSAIFLLFPRPGISPLVSTR